MERKPYNELSVRQQDRRLKKEMKSFLANLQSTTATEDNNDIDSDTDSYTDTDTDNGMDIDRPSICNGENNEENLMEDEYISDTVENVSQDNDCVEFERFLEQLDKNNLDVEEISDDTDSVSSLDDYFDDDDISEDEKEEVPEFQQFIADWCVQHHIGYKPTNDLLAGLRERGHEYLPKDRRTLVRTPRETNIIQVDPGEYFHYGLKQSIIDLLGRYTLESAIVFDLNVDGLPITKSTSRVLWPIMGKIVNRREIPPFIIGIYHGKHKPYSARSFLAEFISEYQRLNSSGFLVKNWLYKPILRCVICDSPARSFVASTKQHNGHFGCGKCTQEGSYVNNRMLYLQEHARLRTNESFRRRSQPEHHQSESSPFEDLQIDMIKAFPLDYMHLVLLGVTKLLIKIWLTIEPKFCARAIQQISDNFVGLSQYVPSEFNRKPQSLAELGRWKATTFRLFLLYAGPIILPSSLPKKILAHFNCLNCAIRILCDIDLHANDEMNTYAHSLLILFVETFKKLFGPDYVVFNVHNLVHLCEDVRSYGPLDTFSAFDFENNMKFVHRMFRKKAHPLPQFHRRLAEGACAQVNQPEVFGLEPLLKSPNQFQLPLGCTDGHDKLLFRSFKLTNKMPDNCCFLKDKSIILIEHIGRRDFKTVVVGRKFKKIEKVDNYPNSSLSVGFCQVKKLGELQVFEASIIEKKACLFMHNEIRYVMPLLHH